MRLSFRALLAFLAAVFLAAGAQVPASAGSFPETVQRVCRECNGYRYQIPGQLAVYVVIDGVRHHVPDQPTYLNLWAGFADVIAGGGTVDIGDPLVVGAFLALEVETGRVYLVGRSKRWIPNPAILHQYAFDEAKIRRMSQASLPGRGPDIPGR